MNCSVRLSVRKLLSTLITLGVILISFNLSACATVTINPEPAMPNATATPMSHNKTHFPPEILAAVRQDLAQRTNAPIEKIQFLSAQPMVWPDGCLGLAQADEVCTQVLVEGWQVELLTSLSTGDHTWIYRTDNSGRTLRLTTP